MSEEYLLRVRVMDWITDSPVEQQLNMELFQSFSKIRHLEIRLTAWTIHQESRLHVGINTVPAILGAAKVTIEEMTIDLECLSRDSILTTFCKLISNPSKDNQLEKLTIICSGEEEMSSYSLTELGRAFQSLKSITTLKILGVDADHLSRILSSMQIQKSCIERCVSCPSLCSRGNQKPCPRILPSRSWDAYEAIAEQEQQEENLTKGGYPKHLELHRVRLFPSNMSNLTHLLAQEHQSNILHLTLCDCTLTTEDLELLTYLVKGHSVLQELTLERLHMRSFQGLPPWWNINSTCTPSVPKPCKSTAHLATVRLMDCRGSRKDLEMVTDALVQNDGLRNLVLQYSSTETCSMTIHALNALYLSTVIHNKACPLRRLQVSAGPNAQSYKLQQLASLLGHPMFRLEKLTLDFGVGPYHLGVLGEKLCHNSQLSYLAISGDELLNVETLHCFVAMLQDTPQLKVLELDFPGISEMNPAVLPIFRVNTTLEEVRIVGWRGGSNNNEFLFLGLRNRLIHLLRSRPDWRYGTWNEVLHLLLNWQECTSSQVGSRGTDLVFLSGLWFAFTECPLMVSELETLENEQRLCKKRRTITLDDMSEGTL